MPMLDPHTGQLIGTVDRLKSALQAQPVLAPGKTDLPPGMPGYGPPQGQPPKTQDRLAQAIAPAQPPMQQPIDAEFETVREPREGMPPAPLTGEARDKEALRRMGQALMQFGTPAQQVQGMKLLSEASRPSATEQAAADKQRYLNAIEDSPASDGAKDRARTMLELGADSKQIMEALQFDARGLAAQQEQKDLRIKDLQKLAGERYKLGVMETAANDALEIIENSDFATGGTGYLMSYLPFDNPAYNLAQPLDTLKAILGFDRLQQMRQVESPSGGALGNVTELELKFLQATQGSLDQFQDSDILKANVISVVEGKKLLTEAQALASAIDAGDPQAVERYLEITERLGTIGADVRKRIKQVESTTDVPTAPGAEDIEAQYGLR